MRRPLLKVNNLSVEYATEHGHVHALRDIDFSLPKGEILGIVGESGCGKSTLLSAILGLMDSNANVDSGHILFKQKDLLKLNNKEWQNIRGVDISVVFQDPMQAHNPVLTIGQQMIDIQYRSKKSKKDKINKAIQMLEKVSIPDPQLRLKQYPHEFSGGMRQRIAIAMALMSKPSLLIADEPTTALDATLEVQVLELLKSLQQEFNCSIIFISHHLSTIAYLCDEVMVMYAGETIEKGRTKEVFLNPRHPYTKALIECDPGYIKEKKDILPTIEGTVPKLVNLSSSCIFHERCKHTFEPCKTKLPEYSFPRPDHYVKCHLFSTNGDKS